MKKILLAAVWCLVLFFASGCVMWGSKDPFCSQEECIVDDSFLFPASKTGEVPIVSSRFLPQEKAYLYVLTSKNKETGKTEETQILARYFLHNGFYHADLTSNFSDHFLKGGHYPAIVGVLGDSVLFVLYFISGDDTKKFENCEQCEVVKNKEGKAEKIVFKGTPAQLKKLLGNLLCPILILDLLQVSIPRHPLPLKADGLFSRKYREKFLLYYLRLWQDELRRSSNIDRKTCDQRIGFIEEALNEDGTKKLSPEVVAEARKMIAELKRMVDAKAKKE